MYECPEILYCRFIHLYLSMISVTLFLHYSIDSSSLSHTYPTSLYDMGYRWDIYGISMGYLRDNLNKMMDGCRIRYGFEGFEEFESLKGLGGRSVLCVPRSALWD